ncbi:MAG: MerR family transcriptional regulator [Desulfobacterales bacterium]|nr:MerR family transcriptional regulator [Desulfobacterales bacterium]
MYTIGELCNRFGLSRSTLLYYDRLGLLKPSTRTESNYRLYTDEDIRKLEQICLYRNAGVSLKDMKILLNPVSDERTVVIIKEHFENINNQIKEMRKQQQLIIELLKKDVIYSRNTIFNLKSWSSLLISMGFSQKEMNKWHVEFEKQSPEEHTAFLKSLGLSEKEIKLIRHWHANQDESIHVK